MFGYIIVNKPEMKIKDFEVYHSFYCGLCRSLKKKYGWTGQSTLSYDMTFLYILLTALYEPETKEERIRCLLHPLQKHPALENEFAAYAADMNVLLSYYKCKDDWQDDRKYLKLAYEKLLNPKCRKLIKEHREKVHRIDRLLREIRKGELKGVQDLDEMAGKFGEVMAEIFACRTDEWERSMRAVGFWLGKFIYLMDAYEDVEQDIASCNYNPFRERYRESDFEAYANTVLTMMMAECSRAFETLPILEHAEILRNILYSGVWFRYGRTHRMREENKVEEHDRSI